LPAPISVIIPTLNATAGLGPTLAALAPGLEDGLIREVILSDGGSDDAMNRIADAAGATLVRGAAGRGAQMRRGANTARAPWLLFLHADTSLSPDWSAEVMAHLRSAPNSSQKPAACFRLRFDGTGRAPRWIAGWANFRTKAIGLPYGDQGLLIHAETLAEIGGYPDLPLMEDVALARRLTVPITPLAATATTSFARYEANGPFRQGAANLWRLARYTTGASPARLAKSYEDKT